MNRLKLFLCLLPGLMMAPAHATGPKTLRYAFEIAETGFDPIEISDIYSRAITENIFEAPLRFAYLAPSGTLEPATADGMPEVSNDFKTFTIRIKKGIYFTDDPAFNGQPRELTAADYVYSYKRIFDPHWNSPYYDQYSPVGIVGMEKLRSDALKSGHFNYDRTVEGLKTIDRYTFQINVSVSQPRFLQDLADSSNMGAVAREVVEKYGEGIMEHPVGTGPFRLAEWRRSSLIVLERNAAFRPDFFHVKPDPADADAQKIAAQLDGKKLPLIDRVEISVIEESQPRWLSFLNREADLLYVMPRDLADLALPNGKPAPNLLKRHVRVERQPQIDVTTILYNMDNPTIGGYSAAKVALRRALNLGINTPEVIRTYYKFQAFPAQSVIVPGNTGYDAGLRTENGLTSAARARALLDEYGYLPRHRSRWRDNPDGSPLVLEISTEPDQHSRILDEIFQKSLDTLDIRCTFKVAKWPDQLKAVRAANYMIWFLGNTAFEPDPSEMLRLGYGPATGEENMSRFKLGQYDELYMSQDRLADGPERLEIVRRMSALLTAYAPFKLLAHRYTIDMTYPWVLYYRRWPFTHSDFLRYIDIDQALEAKSVRP